MSAIIVLLLSLFATVQGAALSTKYAEKFAEGFRVSRFTVGFIIVSFVSILPETMIAISAAFQDQPEFGIGTIMGSSVADLTLVFAIITFATGKSGLRVEKQLANKLLAYPLFLSIPMFLGLDGNYSRAEGITMIIVGVIFYIFIFSKSVNISGGPRDVDSKYRWRNVSFLILSLLLLLFGAYFTVESATELANMLGVAPVLVGILIVGLGAVIPELAFSYKAVKDRQPSLAVGDIMGSVLAATTVVIGLLALIHPFDFPARITYVAGIFMVVSSIILVFFIKSHYRIKRPEAVVLLLIWLVYIAVEILA